jgi:hypothetical protein
LPIRLQEASGHLGYDRRQSALSGRWLQLGFSSAANGVVRNALASSEVERFGGPDRGLASIAAYTNHVAPKCS